MTTQSTSPISVLGLGAMGSALASALVDAGHPITVWNRSAGRSEAFAARGASVAPNSADAFAASPVVVMCLVDDAAVREVVDQASDAMAGRVVVNLTNGTPEQARMGAERSAELGAAAYLDGGIMAVPPMIGSPDAFVLYSGSTEAFDQVEHLLAAFGGARFLGEDPGLASLCDLALLSGMYGLFGGVLHAFALAGSEGIEPAAFGAMLLPWLQAMVGEVPRVAEQLGSGSYATTSPLAMQAPGLANIADASTAQGVGPDLIEPIRRLVERGVDAGHGDEDIAALVGLLASAEGRADPRPTRGV